MKDLKQLQTYSMYFPRTFDRVTLRCNNKPFMSLLGKCYSQYTSAPSLVNLADAAHELNNDCHSSSVISVRYLGYSTMRDGGLTID